MIERGENEARQLIEELPSNFEELRAIVDSTKAQFQ